MPRPLDDEEVSRQLRDLPGWSGDTSGLTREVLGADYRAAVSVVVDVAEVAEQMDHHPDISLGWRMLRFELRTHVVGAVSQYDIELAHRIDEVLRDHGLG